MGEKEREGTVEHARENSASLDKTSWQRKRERGREREGGEREDDREGKEKEQEQAAGVRLLAPQSLCLPPLVGGQRRCHRLLSPSPFLALPSCYVIKLEEQ